MSRRTPRVSTPVSAPLPRRATRDGLIAPFTGALALAALLWACRGAPLGVPAADDYDYLYALDFQRPLDPLGPMGSLWYWRPLGRQAYYALFQGAFFGAPWLVAGVHLLLLAALFTLAYRSARHGFDAWSAAAIAAFPLLAEPTRALLSWPTGAQPLLAMTLIALALHEALARRMGTALAALLAALLCHEQALLAVPVVGLALAARAEDPGAKARAWGAALAVGVAYGAVRWIAFGHGAGLPPRSGLAGALAAWPAVLGESLAAQFGLATLGDAARTAVLATELGLAACALALLVRRDARARIRARARALSAGGAWFLLGILPLAFAAALWTPRHTCLPGLGLGLLAGGLLACASPALAALLTAVRLVALLLAPTAPQVVPERLSAQTTPMSFLHVARLQRTADSARRALLEAHPALRPGTNVGYWSLPRETQIAFAGKRAVDVWYADSTIGWTFWQRDEPGTDRSRDPILGFNVGVADPAVVMRPGAIRRYQEAIAAWSAGDLWPAQMSFFGALRAQQPPVHNFTNETVRLMARIAYARGNYDRADSLNRVDYRMSGESPTYYGMEALLHLAQGDSAHAAEAAERCLRLRPNDDEGLAVLRALGRAGPTM